MIRPLVDSTRWRGEGKKLLFSVISFPGSGARNIFQLCREVGQVDYDPTCVTRLIVTSSSIKALAKLLSMVNERRRPPSSPCNSAATERPTRRNRCGSAREKFNEVCSEVPSRRKVFQRNEKPESCSMRIEESLHRAAEFSAPDSA